MQTEYNRGYQKGYRDGYYDKIRKNKARIENESSLTSKDELEEYCIKLEKRIVELETELKKRNDA